ncbi:MAG: hypothetical protein ACRDRO_00970 [Pseudonocardiaceae bacterium]
MLAASPGKNFTTADWGDRAPTTTPSLELATEARDAFLQAVGLACTGLTMLGTAIPMMGSRCCNSGRSGRGTSVPTMAWARSWSRSRWRRIAVLLAQPQFSAGCPAAGLDRRLSAGSTAADQVTAPERDLRLDTADLLHTLVMNRPGSGSAAW